MKRFIICFLFIILFSSTIHTIKYHKRHFTFSENTIQKNISSKIIRLHVIGNSNSSYDQKVKLKIKNEITTELKPLLYNAKNKSQARKIIQKNISKINKVANKILIQNNLPYSTTTSLSTVYFPIKQYGDMTLPEGYYESVNVKLGSASGKNWWCVLYPTLCFVDCTYSVLPADSKTKLKASLTPSEYNYIMNQPDTTVTYKSYMYSIFKNIISIPK